MAVWLKERCTFLSKPGPGPESNLPTGIALGDRLSWSLPSIQRRLGTQICQHAPHSTHAKDRKPSISVRSILQPPHRTALPLYLAKVPTRCWLECAGVVWRPVWRLIDGVAELPLRRRWRQTVPIVMMVVGRRLRLIGLVAEYAKGKIGESDAAKDEK